MSVKTRILKGAVRPLLTLSLGIALSISLTLVSVVARAVEHSPCADDLGLLSADLRVVLNDLAHLYLEAVSADPAFPARGRLVKLLQEKSQDLQKLFPDERMLSLAKTYIRERFLQIEGDAAKIEKVVAIEESNQRHDEDLFLSPYESIPFSEIPDIRYQGIGLTSGGFVIAQTMKTITVHNLETHESRTFPGLISNDGSEISYSEADGGELLYYPIGKRYVSREKILKISLSKLFTLTPAKASRISGETYLLRNNENIKKMFSMIGRVFPKARINEDTLFSHFTASKNGKFIASEFWYHDPDGPERHGVIVYDHEQDRFIVMKTPGKELESSPTGLEISANGKFLAITEARAVGIYDVSTGERLRGVNVESYSVAFSHDSKKILCSGGKNQVVLADVSGGTSPQIIQVSDNVDEANFQTHPIYVGFSPDDSEIFAESEKGHRWVWGIETGNLLHTFSIQGNGSQTAQEGEILMTKRYHGGQGWEVFFWKRRH